MTDKTGDSDDDLWEVIRDTYPMRAGGQGWVDAERLYRAHIKKGVKPQDVLDGVIRYRQYIEASGRLRTEYVKQARTFFGRGKHWAETPGAPTQAVSQQMTVAKRQADTLNRLRENSERARDR